MRKNEQRIVSAINRHYLTLKAYRRRTYMGYGNRHIIQEGDVFIDGYIIVDNEIKEIRAIIEEKSTTKVKYSLSPYFNKVRGKEQITQYEKMKEFTKRSFRTPYIFITFENDVYGTRFKFYRLDELEKRNSKTITIDEAESIKIGDYIELMINDMALFYEELKNKKQEDLLKVNKSVELF